MHPPDFYFDVLYPLQDRVLDSLRDLDTGFYLAGGTAASRAYLQHRFSDDLDLFTNDSPEFRLWAERLIDVLAATADWRMIRWIDAPDVGEFLADLRRLGEELLRIN